MEWERITDEFWFKGTSWRLSDPAPAPSRASFKARAVVQALVWSSYKKSRKETAQPEH